jgi:FKBP-type peptidyl-prolyl cis-trans isomerase
MLPGLADALLLMKPGARWEVYLPTHLGYGASGKDRVPPNTVLIFDLALEEIVR